MAKLKWTLRHPYAKEIVDLRKKDYNFREISEIITEKRGEVISRQACHQIYKDNK